MACGSHLLLNGTDRVNRSRFSTKASTFFLL
jgi:hypothetical protein